MHPYKLVPKHIFDELKAKEAFKKQIMENDNSDVRSVKKIQENVLDETINSSDKTNAFYEAAKQHAIQQNKLNSGSGKDPLWVYNGEDVLPQFSKPHKLQRDNQLYENVLNSNDIPAKLKIELLEYYRSKYMNTKHRSKDVDTNSESEDDNYKNATKDGIRIALRGIIPLHKKRAQSIANALSGFPKHLRWNATGEIIHPKYAHHIDLGNILDVLVNEDRGARVHLKQIEGLIYPFYEHIKKWISNRSIMQKIVEWEGGSPPPSKPKVKKKKSKKVEVLVT